MRLSQHAFRSLTRLSALSILSGCAVATSGGAPTTPTIRGPVDAPVRLEVVDPALRVAPADTIRGQGCQSPLVDPRYSARMRMVRSGNDGIGDYEVPEGRYGVRAGEVLRVECNTGRVLGIAPRQRNNP